MTQTGKHTFLSPEQIMAVINDVKDADSIQDLLCAAIKKTNMEIASYHHLAGAGTNDKKGMQRHFSFNLPQPLEDFFNTRKLTHEDPGVAATFSAGTPVWISDMLEHELVKGLPSEAEVKSLLELTGDGMLLALFGPAGRKGYAFVTFGKPKDHFCPVFEWQIHAMLQMLHVRYCVLLNDLESKINLTKRETEVIELLVLGKTNPEIGIILDISKNTVASYLKGIFLKLRTNDRVTVALRARALNLVD